MKIRKIVYNLDFVPILTFKEHYKLLIAPYLSYNNFKFAIDNENTINERIRLVFPTDKFVFNFRKEGATMAYEGDIEEITKNNPIVSMFFDIYEKIKAITGYHKTTKQKIIINAVDIETKATVDEALLGNKYLMNPFGKLSEFSAVFEFESEEKKYVFQFGNYSELDIKKFDLSAFNADYNKDLKDNIGFICHIEIEEEINNSSFAKLKTMLTDAQKRIEFYLENLK